MSDLFPYLKQQTRDAHQALEAHYPFNRMLQSAHFETEDYRLMLRVMLSFHQSAQQWLTTLPSAQRDMLQSDTIINALNRDLHSLYDNEDVDIPDFEMPVIKAPDEAIALATSYVWMGSSLGGKIIERWLYTTFSELPRAYYAQMKVVSNDWPAYIRMVGSQHDYSAAQIAQVADFVNALFTGLRETAIANSRDMKIDADD